MARRLSAYTSSIAPSFIIILVRRRNHQTGEKTLERQFYPLHNQSSVVKNSSSLSLSWLKAEKVDSLENVAN